MSIRLGPSGLSRDRPRGPGAAYGKLAPVRPGGRAVRPAPLLRRALGKDTRLRQLDWVLLLAVLALCFIGTLLVSSATRGVGSHAYVVKQLMNIVIGLILLALVSMLDYRQLRLCAPVLYGASLLGLLAALTPL